MKKTDIAAALSSVVLIALALMAVGGWVLNIVKLASASSFETLEAVRAFGIVMPPLGAIMGLFV